MAQRRLGFWRRAAVAFVVPVLQVWTKRTWTGQENLPPEGGVIVVPNHISQFDPLVVAHFVYGSGRWPRFLAKGSLWRVPVLGPLLRKTLQIPVERGSVEAVRSIDVLVDAVHQGGAIIVYPEGTTTREPDLWPMRGKTGAARLALATGAPVVPVASWGAQQVFHPQTKKFSVRPRVPVTVTAGKPVDLSRWAGATPTKAVLDQMTEVIMLSVRELVGDLRGGTPPPLYARPPRPSGRPE
ncbi:lysophospholipid acyltransferase family protein [Mangrovihabitans endophyticus]|uniref:lysophospholipid acyltransferase family protein n=1 Tax=Mangrovihabitans endophyticus TaxID=1751298 RepID=UPI001664F508|nr:lysophospholipid acyltransferase family protein [Mangrovihabitans endophyticus]